MKKRYLLCTLLAGSLLLTGCGSQKEETLTCTRTTNSEDMKIELKYEVKHKGGNALLVKSEERITSDDKEYLEEFKDTVEKQYSPYKDLEHYDYSVTIDGNTLISTTNIDYENIDTDKMIEIDSANGALIKNGKIKVSDLQAAYEALGTTCK